MGWSKGIDVVAGEQRVLSAKTTYDEHGRGEVLINSVDGENTRIHLGFEVPDDGTISIWGVATDRGKFSGTPQEAIGPIHRSQPIARLAFDPDRGLSDLALNISSARTLQPVTASQELKRAVVHLRGSGARPAVYTFALTADSQVARDLASAPGHTVQQLFGGARPVWLDIEVQD